MKAQNIFLLQSIPHSLLQCVTLFSVVCDPCYVPGHEYGIMLLFVVPPTEIKLKSRLRIEYLFYIAKSTKLQDFCGLIKSIRSSSHDFLLIAMTI